MHALNLLEFQPPKSTLTFLSPSVSLQSYSLLVAITVISFSWKKSSPSPQKEEWSYRKIGSFISSYWRISYSLKRFAATELNWYTAKSVVDGMWCVSHMEGSCVHPRGFGFLLPRDRDRWRVKRNFLLLNSQSNNNNLTIDDCVDVGILYYSTVFFINVTLM